MTHWRTTGSLLLGIYILLVFIAAGVVIGRYAQRCTPPIGVACAVATGNSAVQRPHE